MTTHDKKSLPSGQDAPRGLRLAASPEWRLPDNCPHRLEELPSIYAGFIYRIQTHDGREYIGKKFLRTRNWQSYFGSSSDLNHHIREHGRETLSREIISLHVTEQETSYAEVCELFARDVLNTKLADGRHKYFNKAIVAGRYFRAKDARP